MPDPNHSPAFAAPPHWHSGATVRAIMLEVAAALLPGLLVALWLRGPALLTHLLLACATAWGIEWCALRLRGQRPQAPIGDGSALITAMLLAICLPSSAPWYLTVSGTAFALGVVKHCYGGLGQNIFNPAMAGYVFVLLCFPAELLNHPPPGAAPGLWAALGTPFGLVSNAAPAAFVQAGLHSQGTLAELRAPGLEWPEQGQVWLAAAWFIGGAWLLARRIIRWRIPLAMLGALGLAALLTGMVDDQRFASAWFHWLHGGAILAAFFIATDPVSSASTPRGQLFYGAGIGLLTWYMRNWGDSAGAIAFAVLIMNAFAPLLDSLPHRPAPGAEV